MTTRRSPRRKVNPLDEDEYPPHVSLDGNMGPATQAKLKQLIAERVGPDYLFPIEVHSGSGDAAVLRRHRISATGEGNFGRKLYEIPYKRLTKLVIDMARSGREDDYSFASAILTVLGIELV